MSKAKKISLMDAAMKGATTPSMGEPGMAMKPAKKKNKKTGKVSILEAAIMGATTPTMGKTEIGKSAAEKSAKVKKK